MNMDESNEYNIFGSIVTKDSFIENPQIPIECIETFIEKIVKPLNESLKFKVNGKNLRMRPDVYPLDDKNWTKMKKAFQDGKIIEIEIWSNLIKEQIYGQRIIICVSISEDSKLSSIEFCVNRGFYKNGVIPKDVADSFIELIKDLSSKITNLSAYITFNKIDPYIVNNGSVRSPHEIYTYYAFCDVAPLLNKYFRGYFWGNFLSKDHVELLGGIEKIEREAPVYKTKRLEDGGLYLQLTEDINNISDDDLRRLKEFLSPILLKRKRERDKRFDIRYKGMRIIKDDGEK